MLGSFRSVIDCWCGWIAMNSLLPQGMHGWIECMMGGMGIWREQLAAKNLRQSVLDVKTVVSIGDGIDPSIWA
jgi:hypothetical protein